MLPERLLPALPGGGLPDLPPHLLRRSATTARSTSRASTGWCAASSSSSSTASSTSTCRSTRPRSRAWRRCSGICSWPFLLYLQVSGQFHLDRRDAPPVRLQPAGDAPPLLPGLELHRLLAPDQHLLEGLHDEGLLLSGLLQAAQAREHARPRPGHLLGLLRDLGPALLPVVLAPRVLSCQVERHRSSGPSWPCWWRSTWCTSRSTRPGAGWAMRRCPGGGRVVTGLKTLGVFATICVLWSLWISDSVPRLALPLRGPRARRAGDLRLIPILLAGVIGVRPDLAVLPAAEEPAASASGSPPSRARPPSSRSCS